MYTKFEFIENKSYATQLTELVTMDHEIYLLDTLSSVETQKFDIFNSHYFR